ncbi:MAG TPA: hypothetical protein PLB14_01875 [Smithellaceae bacterium]|jgi:hypothetical protein|nr:hypothetical protein [Syntrophaceae bacterium]HPL96289.1 hypothetical protein [Smithellaceae bacterium]HPV48425.1 hypothetical protein [Smithellaceae bacterium]
MNDITSIASAVLAMQQSQTHDLINVAMLRMNAEAEAAMADMLLQNARQIEALTHAAAGGVIDLFA